MIDPNAKLVTVTHGQGHGNAPTRSFTPDGQRVVDWAKTLPARQNAAVVTAYGRLGLEVTDTGLTKDQYGQEYSSKAPPRYDFHTGEYFDYGQATTGGVVICTDPSLLVAKGHR